MNQHQVSIKGFIRSLRKQVRKVDKHADIVIIDVDNHYAGPNAAYTQDKYAVHVTVFHKSILMYSYKCEELPTPKQFKQRALSEYKRWLQKDSVA